MHSKLHQHMWGGGFMIVFTNKPATYVGGFIFLFLPTTLYSHFLEMGDTFFTNKVFFWVKQMTWSLWKGTPKIVMIFVCPTFRKHLNDSPMGATYSAKWRVEETQVGPLSNEGWDVGTLLTNATRQSAGRFYVQQIGDYSTNVHTITQNGSYTILNCSPNSWDFIQH